MDRLISTASKMTYVSFLARWIRACVTLDSGDLNHACEVIFWCDANPLFIVTYEPYKKGD